MYIYITYHTYLALCLGFCVACGSGVWPAFLFWLRTNAAAPELAAESQMVEMSGLRDIILSNQSIISIRYFKEYPFRLSHDYFIISLSPSHTW